MEASVTIKPSLTLNIPTNTITMNLDPSNHSFDEKDLTVSVGTNNRYGYQLLVNTTSTNLINVADSSKTIPNLSSSVSPSTFSSCTSSDCVNKWGYRISDGNTSSGDYGQFTSGIISQSSGPVNNITKTLGFGAKIDYTKESGLYNLNLEFKALPIVTQTYMQNMDTNLCTSDPTVVIDQRDEKPYTIRRLPDGRCWMVENLRLAPETTITNANSNISAASYALPADTTAFSTDYAPGAHCSDDIDTGCWYNINVATAGTIAGISDYESQYDICPSGWRLPSYNEMGGTTDYTSQFNPVTGGYWDRGNNPAKANGFYWSSTPSPTIASGTTGNRYYLYYNSTNDTMDIRDFYNWSGMHVRCILNEPAGTITTLQQFGALSSSDKTALKNSMVTGKPYSLRDTRDNQMYTVAKLEDGNVWLANNLNLGATTLNGNLTSSNTNLSTTVAKATFEGWKKSSGTRTYTSAEYIPITPSNSTTSSGIDNISKNAYGTLYNYCATSGGDTRACIGQMTAQLNPSYDICPSGWRLMQQNGYSSGEYSNLYSQYNSSLTSMRAPISQGGTAFSLSGVFSDAAPQSVGSAAYYWSYIRLTNEIMNTPSLSNRSTSPGNSQYRSFGGPIRCLLK